jgi:phage terminase large subunit-like protein
MIICMGLSLQDRMALLPVHERQAWVRAQPPWIIEEIQRGEWWWVARPEQVPPPGNWLVCLALAGRGFGKSRAGSEWIVNQVLRHPFDRHGVPTEWLVIAETLSDARTICMEGPAGILRVLERRKIKHRYKMSPRPMVLFPSGAKIYSEGADDPDVARGYNASGSWMDEIGKWKYPKKSWYEGIMPSLRADLIGDHPRAFVTTTPKPIDIIQEWSERDDGSVHIIRGSTFDNRSNLSALVIDELKRRYEGTIIGRQELYGEIIEGYEGALFSRLDIENNRVWDSPDNLVNTVVGVDPSLTGEDDEMGIVVVSRTRDNHLYVIADRSIMSVGRAAALEAWRVVAEWGADKMVCEVNLGKRWMQQVFHDAYYELVGQGIFERNTKPPIVGIDTKIGKRTRGEPVAMRCEQGRLHMVGRFKELEDQMSTFVGWGTRESPDRLDALVHACRFLMDGEKKQARITSPRDAISTTLQSLLADVGSYNSNF